MTRGKVLLIGLAVLLLGGVGYVGFDAAGLEGFSAGIAAQAVLVLIVVIWTSSYLFRVVTGQMTYMQQRRRYREVYDEQEIQDLDARFEALSPDEQQALLRKIGVDEQRTRTHRPKSRASCITCFHPQSVLTRLKQLPECHKLRKRS